MLSPFDLRPYTRNIQVPLGAVLHLPAEVRHPTNHHPRNKNIILILLFNKHYWSSVIDPDQQVFLVP
jgi:hypothetical protein